MLPGGGILIALCAGWLLSKQDRDSGFRAYEKLGPALAGIWTVLIRFVTPVLVVLVILGKLGVFSDK